MWERLKKWASKNKGWVIGGGVAVTAGLFVLYQRSSDPATGEDGPGSGGGGAAVGGIGYPGASPDVAGNLTAFLSDYSANLADQLQESQELQSAQLQEFIASSQAARQTQAEMLGDTLGEFSSALAQGLDKIVANNRRRSSGGGGGSKRKSSGGGGGSRKRFVTVRRFTTRNPPWQSTLSGIAGHEGTSVGRLLDLNPSISNPDLIHPGQRIRVR